MNLYINVAFNHFAAVREWAAQAGADAFVDMKDFTLEVKHKGRYYRMYPLFQGTVQGRAVHLTELTPDVRGFGGWKPYDLFTHSHSTDKQKFKEFLVECDIRSPALLDAGQGCRQHDYVVKARSGSFGQGLFGPYRAGARPRVPEHDVIAHGSMFAEEFVQGQILKVWFWGARPFFAHVHSYPTIVGDGTSTVEVLLERKVSAARLPWEGFRACTVAAACLEFQGASPGTVLGHGSELWIDYRYRQQYSPNVQIVSAGDNQLEELLEQSGRQVEEMGQALAGLLRRTTRLPVLISVDGMLDASGRIWWLEMNTNSLLPPEGYSVMFADLFP
ncbi:MAG: hypothetical protein JWP65_3741 [Ramlibacter sp.]|jgi:hypothetical protein|uniref:hypothetical protein n=1 Tax=Ramlibacter sp. TaxID=1917967 RepID=UPI002622133F|nr:hypothetical protein [Ramlibacter sp.]MDB5753320.1 hypothetical protein [Ramlibacter sp.]